MRNILDGINSELDVEEEKSIKFKERFFLKLNIEGK